MRIPPSPSTTSRYSQMSPLELVDLAASHHAELKRLFGTPMSRQARADASAHAAHLGFALLTCRDNFGRDLWNNHLAPTLRDVIFMEELDAAWNTRLRLGSVLHIPNPPAPQVRLTKAAAPHLAVLGEHLAEAQAFLDQGLRG
ncbi:hypothetical protein AB0N09_35765 [Streptomyces erythrochromogenes]|uniref:hypothetical protein n=1 Tax=Streptomyces erythrochromogenes TaxID=285574 RepID=UPI0034265E49